GSGQRPPGLARMPSSGRGLRAFSGRRRSWFLLRIDRLHPREQLLVLLAERLLVLRTHRALNRRDLLLLTLDVGVRGLDLLLLKSGQSRAVDLDARVGSGGRARSRAGAGDRVKTLGQILVDLVGLLVLEALVPHADGPLLGRGDHALVLHDALVELVQL